jgi:hypothetical protein
MVLSNSSMRARYQNTIMNQNQGGGSKKAGLVPLATKTEAKMIALRTRGYPQSRKFMSMTINPRVSQSANIGRRMNIDYWKIPGL